MRLNLIGVLAADEVEAPSVLLLCAVCGAALVCEALQLRQPDRHLVRTAVSF